MLLGNLLTMTANLEKAARELLARLKPVREEIRQGAEYDRVWDEVGTAVLRLEHELAAIDRRPRKPKFTLYPGPHDVFDVPVIGCGCDICERAGRAI